MITEEEFNAIPPYSPEWIDVICEHMFEDYDPGISGYENRETLRLKRPSVYEDLKKVTSYESFKELIARYKMEGV